MQNFHQHCQFHPQKRIIAKISSAFLLQLSTFPKLTYHPLMSMKHQQCTKYLTYLVTLCTEVSIVRKKMAETLVLVWIISRHYAKKNYCRSPMSVSKTSNSTLIKKLLLLPLSLLKELFQFSHFSFCVSTQRLSLTLSQFFSSPFVFFFIRWTRIFFILISFLFV